MMNDRIYYSREAEQMAAQQRTILALVVMLLGLGLGAVVALLFAPRKGEDVRNEIANQAGVLYENGRDTTNKTLKELQKDFDKLRGDIEERLKNVSR
ncbi:MAG: YtxH domain-containing protein [Anaerolineae bacterium]|nr:YtxH domain-containing protein [Anaerolineae bacterium]